MGFIQPCFIRKNTPELRKKLEELGYKKGVSPLPVGREDIYDRDLHLFENKYHFRTYTCYGVKNNIDCGTNEELFLALAALRDDTDKYQWFFSSGWTDFEGNSLPDKWILCDQDTLEKFAFVNNSPNSYKTGWKKANVQELIEHFKSI